jgi:hypothetical protein
VVAVGPLLKQLEPGQFLLVEKIPGGGSLEARRLVTGGVQFYWRHTQDKRTKREPIGIYDSLAPPKALKPTSRGYSIAAATESARELAKLNNETPGGIRAKQEQERAERKNNEEAQRRRSEFTLKALCAEYVDWLAQQKKVSSSDAKNVFNNHVLKASPELAEKAASELDKRDVIKLLRKLTESGKATTARKLRSYLRAAFACALRADSDASLPSSFIDFGISNNPVEATAAIPGHADKNPLALEELRKYWKTLKKEPGVIGAALRFHAVSGGQRVAQLVRLHRADVSKFSIRLMDAKGKRAQPRVHLLPITSAMKAELAQLPKRGFVLSTDEGVTRMHPTSLSAWAAAAADRAGLKDFQLKRVRSGIETALAEAGLSLHVRGLVQSHGLGGVQEKHYDAHEYMPEKREALEALYSLLGDSKNKRSVGHKFVKLVGERSR